MSFARNDRKVRANSGNSFPIKPSADTEATFAAVIAAALRKDFGDTPVQMKHIARLTGVNARTVQNWLQARNGPSGAGLVVLMRHSDEVTTAVLALSNRDDLRRVAETQQRLDALRSAVTAIHDLLGA